MFSLGASPPFGARPASLASREYLRQYGLVESRSGVVLAVSGGADSLAMTLAFADQCERFGLPFVAAVVDHGMREGSGAEAASVKGQLTSLGLPETVILKAEEPVSDGCLKQRPLEADARELRHGLLEDLAQSWGAERSLDSVDILFGHTMDDQAETVLMRLARGASPRALAGISRRSAVQSEPVELYRGHPLLSLRRTDTESFCNALGLDWVEDSSNSLEGSWLTAGGEKLPRNLLRHQVLPQLNQALGQDSVPALARAAELARADSEALDQIASAAFEKLCAKDEKSLELKAADLDQHPQAIRRRIYALAWQSLLEDYPEKQNTPGLSSSRLTAIDRLLTKSVSGPRSPIGKCITVAGGGKICRFRNRLVFRLSGDWDEESY